MNDRTTLSNLFLASFSSVAPILQAFDTQKLIPIISAVILPIFFFCIGKTVDVCVQIYFRRQEAKRLEKQQQNASTLENSTEEKQEK